MTTPAALIHQTHYPAEADHLIVVDPSTTPEAAGGALDVEGADGSAGTVAANGGAGGEAGVWGGTGGVGAAGKTAGVGGAARVVGGDAGAATGGTGAAGGAAVMSGGAGSTDGGAVNINGGAKGTGKDGFINIGVTTGPVAVGARAAISASSYTIRAQDGIVAVTVGTIDHTLTLPAASTVPAGKAIAIKDESGVLGDNSKTITIARAGSDTIDGATSIAITANYGRLAIYSDGTSKWFVSASGVAGGTELSAADKTKLDTLIASPKSVRQQLRVQNSGALSYPPTNTSNADILAQQSITLSSGSSIRMSVAGTFRCTTLGDTIIFQLIVDSTVVAETVVTVPVVTHESFSLVSLDAFAVGAHTCKLQWFTGGNTGTITVDAAKRVTWIIEEVIT